MDKVPEGHRFLDMSDYARPLAKVLVRLLLPTRVSPVHLTLAHTAVGFMAAILFALDRWLPFAGALLLLKSALDAADGSLARARGRPSRVGRFLDSICDVLVTIAVFFGIAAGAWRRMGQAHWALAALAIVFATLQCSVFNYYYVRYRAQTGGDTTSDVNESETRGYAWDNPRALRALHALYRLIYGWQDLLMDHVDTWAGVLVRLVLGGDVLQGRADLLRLNDVAAEAALCSQQLLAGLGAGAARKQHAQHR